MRSEELNADLIGVGGGRSRLATPALVIDLDLLEDNIAHMAAHAGANGIALRPHAKTHKCSQIAKLQIAAGAPGVCVASSAKPKRSQRRVSIRSSSLRPWSPIAQSRALSLSIQKSAN